MPDFPWPLVCPTGQAGELLTRLSRHCAACPAYQPPTGCAYPAYSPYWRDLLATAFVSILGHTPAMANAAADRLQAAWQSNRHRHAAIQLPLLEHLPDAP